MGRAVYVILVHCWQLGARVCAAAKSAQAARAGDVPQCALEGTMGSVYMQCVFLG